MKRYLVGVIFIFQTRVRAESFADASLRVQEKYWKKNGHFKKPFAYQGGEMK